METFLKQNYQNFMIFFTFFLLWFSIQFGKVVEDSVAFVLIISIGVLHGANDLLILSKGEKKRFRLVKYFIVYLSIIVLCILIYLLSSFLAIILFVLLSSYHFGEEYFGEKVVVNKIFNSMYYLAYGVFIFSMLFYSSTSQVDEIMKELANRTFTTFQIELALLLSLSIFLVSNLYLFLLKRNTAEMLLKEVFYLGLLFVVFQTSSLILGFAIYFIFWHSIPSIIHQVEFISGSLTKKSVAHYIKKAFIYWGISVVGLITLYQMVPQIKLFSTLIFVVLFAVTAPHTWVMHKMKS
jgi:Brp/Blh family beta-carotene 15,15'-monooxygenase